jgi:hypothetical protein
MPRIIGGTITHEEHKRDIERLKGKGFEAHESHHVVKDTKPKVKKPKTK